MPSTAAARARPPARSSDTDLRLTLAPDGAGACVASLYAGPTDVPPLARATSPAPADTERALLPRLQAHLETPVASADLQAAGQRLGAILLPPSLADALRSQFADDAPARRLRLSFETDALAALPWEFAHLDGLPLALHPRLRPVRAVPARPGIVASPSRPWRLTLAQADPQTARYPRLLQEDAEREGIQSVLERAPECQDAFLVQPLTWATPALLERHLSGARPDALHLIAHGDLRPSGPVLILHGERPRSDAAIYVEELAHWLAASPPALVVLSLCGSPLAALQSARLLIEQGGVGSVVAMQLPLRDATAPLFGRAFYGALAAGATPEAALAEARQALAGAGIDWGVAVLYRSDAALDAAAPAAAPATSPRHNLPEAERPLIGRRADAQAVRDRILVDGERLVTLTGIGGMGKTRLAQHCARLLLPHFPDGVFWVELDALQGSEEILTALAAALGVEAPTEAALLRFLKGRRLLLALDCFESHIAEAGLIERLLRGAPGLVCLVTSRIVLGLPREGEYALWPLSTPEAIGGKHPRESPIAESQALFVDAARHVQHGFVLTDENREAVEAICQRLEGVPLSLILAAGRLRYLSAQELLAQIEARPLQILRRRGAPGDRHAALQEVIAGSFALLDPEDRQLLTMLSVFVGGFFLEDALAVCQIPEWPGDVLEGLGRLREHSLLHALRRSERTRFRLLDTVREYCASVAHDEAIAPLLARCQEAHRRYYRECAVDLARRQQQTPDATPVATDLALEQGNLRAGWRCAIAAGDDAEVILYADHLGRIYAESGLWADFDALVAAAMEAHRRRDDPERYIKLLSRRAQVARRRGQEEEARLLLERMREHYRATENAEGVANCAMELGNQATDLGAWERAASCFVEAYAMAEKAGSPSAMACIRALQARTAQAQEDISGAYRFIDGAETVAAHCSQTDTLAFVHLIIGEVLLKLGQTERAEATLSRALNLAIELGWRFNASRALLALSALYEASGDLSRAALAVAAAEKVHTTPDARRKAQTAGALTRFRREHGQRLEVQEALRDVRGKSWNILAARLLTTHIAKEMIDIHVVTR